MRVLEHGMPYGCPIYTCFIVFVWFGFMFHVPVNNYGHVEMANLPNHTFSLGKLD